MKRSWPVALLLAVGLGACTGLQQFPKASEDYAGDLTKQDLAYDTALTAINVAGADGMKIRNELVDGRLRVIDLNFKEFQTGLAQEGVAADFGIALVQLGLGGAGSLVSETASKIASAASAGLAGAQQAYSKAALYEKTVSALLAQMIASRKAVLVDIFTGRTKSIEEYPLPAAVEHLEAYAYAGSLPGAVIATAADAKVKLDQAEDKLAKFRDTEFTETDSATRMINWIWPDGIDGDVNTDNVDALRAWIDEDENLVDLPIQKLLDVGELEGARKRAITDLEIP